MRKKRVSEKHVISETLRAIKHYETRLKGSLQPMQLFAHVFMKICFTISTSDITEYSDQLSKD